LVEAEPQRGSLRDLAVFSLAFSLLPGKNSALQSIAYETMAMLRTLGLRGYATAAGAKASTAVSPGPGAMGFAKLDVEDLVTWMKECKTDFYGL
jgi:hypothetical protein